VEHEYCAKCGNTGEIFATGGRCDCDLGSGEINFNDSACLAIPEQYRGLAFNTELIPTDVGDYYPKYLGELHRDISTMKLRNTNIFLAAPPKHAKTCLAYTAIQNLYKKNVEVFPLYDILELRRFMQDFDWGKKSAELEEAGYTVQGLYSVQYLFVKIPSEVSFAVFDALKLLLDRRLRRNGGVTILLSDYGWNYIAEADKRGIFTAMLGDGSFGTINNKTFYRKVGE